MTDRQLNVSTGSQLSFFLEYVCSGITKHVACVNEGLVVESAFYRRTKRSVCQSEASWFQWCPGIDATLDVRKICNNSNCLFGIESLNITESSRICNKYDQYLEVKYTCSGRLFTFALVLTMQHIACTLLYYVVSTDKVIYLLCLGLTTTSTPSPDRGNALKFIREELYSCSQINNLPLKIDLLAKYRHLMQIYY